MRDDVGNRDRRVLDVFVMLIIMLGPMQAYLLVRLVDCPLAATFNALLVSRCCQMLVLGAARYLTLHADYKGWRTEVNLAVFALLWSLHIDANNRLLAHCPSDSHAVGVVGISAWATLVLQSALPVAEGSVGHDLILYALAVVAHVACLPLSQVEWKFFVVYISVGLVAAAAIRYIMVSNDVVLSGAREEAERKREEARTAQAAVAVMRIQSDLLLADLNHASAEVREAAALVLGRLPLRRPCCAYSLARHSSNISRRRAREGGTRPPRQARCDTA